MMSIRHVSHLVRHMSHLFQLGETCVSPFSIPGSNTVNITILLLFPFCQKQRRRVGNLKNLTHVP